MKTRQQILADIEVYRAIILSGEPALTSDSFSLFQYIRNYLATAQQGNQDSVNTAAAILCDVFLQCTITGGVVENEDAIIKMLTVFDIYFDSIQNKFPDENGSLIVAAAVLMKYNSQFYCEFYTQVNNGNPYIVGGADFYTIEQDSIDNALNLPTNDTFVNMLDGVNSVGLTVEVVLAPTHGTVDTTDTLNIFYTPTSGYNGSDSFTYRYLLNGLPVAQSAPFFNVNITVTALPMLVIYGGAASLSVSINSVDNFIDLATKDSFVNVDRNTPGFELEIVQQPLHSVCSVDVDNNVLYTRDGVDNFTLDSFSYRYLLDGIPIPIYGGAPHFTEYIYLDFFNPNISLCTEDIQGRITYTANFNENYSNISDYIQNIEITEVELIVPTATPPSLLDSTVLTNMITPTGNMRTHIANGANTGNKFRISISYDELGVPKTGYFECNLPHFQLTDNLCENFIDAIFTSTLLA